MINWKTIDPNHEYKQTELPELLDCTYPAIKQRVKAGSIKSHKIGGRVYIRGDALITYLGGTLPEEY